MWRKKLDWLHLAPEWETAHRRPAAKKMRKEKKKKQREKIQPQMTRRVISRKRKSKINYDTSCASKTGFSFSVVQQVQRNQKGALFSVFVSLSIGHNIEADRPGADDRESGQPPNGCDSIRGGGRLTGSGVWNSGSAEETESVPSFTIWDSKLCDRIQRKRLMPPHGQIDDAGGWGEEGGGSRSPRQ